MDTRHTEGKVENHTECGCKVKHWGPLGQIIDFCPLHAASPELCLQALRHAPLEGPFGKDARYKAESALAKAKGERP